MTLFFLNYDLRKDRDYQRLYDELEEFKAVRILESLWCFKRTDIDAKGLRKYFANFVDGDDGVSVSEVNRWATDNVLGTPNDL